MFINLANLNFNFQVATGRGTISHYYNLHVVVPSAFILGSGEYHIGEGSTISLVCIIENVSTYFNISAYKFKLPY